MCIFFFTLYGNQLDLHVLTHSFPSRRSSYLRTHDDGKFAHEAASGRQPRIGHGKQQKKRCEARHDVDDAAIVIDTTGMQAVVQHPYAQEHGARRSEEHTSELQSLMRISYAVVCLKKKKRITHTNTKKT